MQNMSNTVRVYACGAGGPWGGTNGGLAVHLTDTTRQL